MRLMLDVRRRKDEDMNSEKPDRFDDMSSTEAAGYIGGTFVAALQAIAPIRMWLITIGSMVFLIRVCNTSDGHVLVKTFAFYLVLLAMVIGSAVCRKERAPKK